MFKHNSHVSEIERKKYYRKTRKENLRLDMSERVVNFPDKFFNEFLSSLNQEDFICYPSLTLYDLLCVKLAEHNNLERQNVLLGNGSESLIKIIFELTSNKHSNIVTSSPCFPMYDVFAKMVGSTLNQVKYVSVGGPKLDLMDIKLAVNDKTSLVVLANPNSPIGDFKHRHELEDLLLFLKKKNILLLIDEAYVDYAAYSISALVNEHDNLIVIQTFSKSFGGAGTRLGCAFSSEKNITLLDKLNLCFPVTGASVKFGLALMNNLSLLEDYTDAVKIQRQTLAKKLEENGYDVISGGCNWIHFNDKSNNSEATKIFKKHNLNFKNKIKLPHDYRDNWIRLTLSSDTLDQGYIKEILNEE